MPSYNRLAVYGHRGWVSSVIFSALAESGAPIKVLYRSSSDVSELPPHVETVIVDTDDEDSLVRGLENVDILICLVGHEGISRELAFISAITRSPSVKLFVPSDLAARYDAEGNAIPVNKAKADVEAAANKAGIPTTIVLTGNFAEFALNTVAMGVKLADNAIVYTGNSENEQLNLCTRTYVAAAYVQLFASTLISSLAGHAFALSELTPTGLDIALALERKHGSPPSVIRNDLSQCDDVLDRKLPVALAAYCRKIWGTGVIRGMMGDDAYEVQGYKKATLDDLIVKGDLKAYREMSPAVAQTIQKLLG